MSSIQLMIVSPFTLFEGDVRNYGARGWGRWHFPLHSRLYSKNTPVLNFPGVENPFIIKRQV